MPPKYEKVCPYCGETCEAYAPNNLNCKCGAKYYFKNGTWLSRKKKNNPDLVEVVRCKDCAHYYEMEGFEYKGRKAGYCMWHSALRGKDDYCSDGMIRL